MNNTERLFKDNEKMIYYLANKFADNNGTDPDDLISYGLEIFMETVMRFDPSRGFRFSTYLYNRLWGRFMDWHRAQAEVPLPVWIPELEDNGDPAVKWISFHEEMIAFKDAVKGLSQDSQELLQAILRGEVVRVHHFHGSILPVSHHGTRLFMKENFGWSYNRTSRAWEEIKVFWQGYKLTA
ncbi:MAG: sigma-70 family RNA polymerase sigma factor [Desulfobacteraceae bacterium]